MKDKYCDIKQILWHQTSYTKKLNQILMFYEETPEYLFNMSATKKSEKRICHLVIRKQLIN